ncbi:MAG: hypothetical protein ACI8VY_000064, partial [Cellvibrionaceae bacterium]
TDSSMFPKTPLNVLILFNNYSGEIIHSGDNISSVIVKSKVRDKVGCRYC